MSRQLLNNRDTKHIIIDPQPIVNLLFGNLQAFVKLSQPRYVGVLTP